MTRRRSSAVALVLVCAGCYQDSYQCTSDAECNLGTAGRCEVDHHCTAIDASCVETGRRYTAHSGDESGACFLGRVDLKNPCAEGQPPALEQGCAATVCKTLPSCCETGWSHVCVLAAQRSCNVSCDTQIAVTATRSTGTELWELGYDGGKWTATPHTELSQLLAFLIPAPGDTKPRIAGLSPAGDALVIEGSVEHDVPLTADRTFQDVSSVDFDRDMRDTVALASQQTSSPGNNFVDVIKIDNDADRELSLPSSVRLAWGDFDRDGYPDAIAEQSLSKTYYLMPGIEADDHTRTLQTLVSSAFYSLATTGAPNARSFEWADLDGDGELDVVASGDSLRVHLATDRTFNQIFLNIDCLPLQLNPTATTCPDADATMVNFASAVRPYDGGSEVIFATPPTRGVYRLTIDPTNSSKSTIIDLPLVGDSCMTLPCPPILAIVVGDLDFDHVLDIVAIDASLQLFVGLSGGTGMITQLVATNPITTTGGFQMIRTSATGVPR